MKRILLASAIAASLTLASFALSQQTSSSTSNEPNATHVSHGDTVGHTGSADATYSESTPATKAKTTTKTHGKSKSGKKAKKTAPPQN